MLTLTIKRKYFEQILNGFKTIEYREYKPYYYSRIPGSTSLFLINGYSKNAPRLKAKITKINLIIKNNKIYYAIHLKNPEIVHNI